MIARFGKEIDNPDSVYYWAYKVGGLCGLLAIVASNSGSILNHNPYAYNKYTDLSVLILNRYLNIYKYYKRLFLIHTTCILCMELFIN